jgi:hypothetical protein
MGAETAQVSSEPYTWIDGRFANWQDEALIVPVAGVCGLWTLSFSFLLKCRKTPRWLNAMHTKVTGEVGG